MSISKVTVVREDNDRFVYGAAVHVTKPNRLIMADERQLSKLSMSTICG